MYVILAPVLLHDAQILEVVSLILITISYRVHFFGMIWIRINDLRSQGSWCIKETWAWSRSSQRNTYMYLCCVLLRKDNNFLVRVKRHLFCYAQFIPIERMSGLYTKDDIALQPYHLTINWERAQFRGKVHVKGGGVGWRQWVMEYMYISWWSTCTYQWRLMTEVISASA